jgi:hypothetical protein
MLLTPPNPFPSPPPPIPATIPLNALGIRNLTPNLANNAVNAPPVTNGTTTNINVFNGCVVNNRPSRLSNRLNCAYIRATNPRRGERLYEDVEERDAVSASASLPQPSSTSLVSNSS